MGAVSQHGLLQKRTLSEQDFERIADLEAICNAQEGLDLKLTIGASALYGEATHANDFLYYEDDTLVGYCALDGSHGSTVELCGMVHPAYRRHGVGRMLLAAAVEECARRHTKRLLLICEDGSGSGRAFVATTCARHAFSEHRLHLDGAAFQARQRAPLQVALRAAAPADLEVLAGLLAGSFGDPELVARRLIALDINVPSQQFFIGTLNETPIGIIKTSVEGDAASIYAFGVLPAYRGRGFGRQVLAQTVERLLAEHREPIAIEVETDNCNALGLYESCGFRATTTFGYYELPLPWVPSLDSSDAPAR